MPRGEDIASHFGVYEPLKTASQKLQPSPGSPSHKQERLPALTLMAEAIGKEAQYAEDGEEKAGRLLTDTRQPPSALLRNSDFLNSQETLF